nr:glutathione S-transferase theta 1 [Ectropis grisescens]
MALKLYYDLMSQPSRALYILLKTAKYNFEPKLVDLRKVEHYSEEFTNINRMQRVPVIDHDGFILTESVAIIKYLSRENVIPATLYPKESKEMARVDEFLEWQHIGLRLHCSMYFRVIYLDPLVTGQKPDPKSVAGYERRMMSALEDLDGKWLGRGTPFLNGATPGAADLMAACEIEQPRMVGFDASQHFENIAAWWPKVRQHFDPYYKEAHVILNKIVDKNAKLSSKI